MDGVGVYVRGSQSSLSGDRECMNESTVEGCAVCTRYTRRRYRAGRGTREWVDGWVAASAALGGNGPDRG